MEPGREHPFPSACGGPLPTGTARPDASARPSRPLLHLLVFGTLSVLMVCISVLIWTVSHACAQQNIPHLLSLVQAQTRDEEPLLPFSDYEKGLDEATHKANIAYINGHPELVRSIQKDLGSNDLEWKLDSFRSRLLFVPERNREYALAFENYCRGVIEFVLQKTNLANPYDKIETLQREKPEIPDQGMTVFLVRNLAEEHLGRYVFSDRARKSVAIELSCNDFTGVLGSYTTNLCIREDGRFEFEANHYMVWQTSAKNPYTLLTVPVEETLHLALRPYTQEAIRKQIHKEGVRDIKGAKRVVQEWMEVEEAVVGGLVRAFVPLYLEGQISPALIQQDVSSKAGLQAYKLLERGVDLTRSIGCEKLIEIYARDPEAVRQTLAGA
ncbi:MAG: hypothetical protein AB1640_09925 [bacterium]